MATATKAAKKTAVKKATASKPATKKTIAKTAASKNVAAKKTVAKAVVRKTAPKNAGTTKAVAKKRTPNAAFMKALTPSPALASIVGDKPLPRTEVVKRMWDYIKKRDLQDSANRRLINADDKLREVFGKPQVNMFEMTALVGKHLS